MSVLQVVDTHLINGMFSCDVATFKGSSVSSCLFNQSVMQLNSLHILFVSAVLVSVSIFGLTQVRPQLLLVLPAWTTL